VITVYFAKAKLVRKRELMRYSLVRLQRAKPMVPNAAETEVRLAGPEEADRFSRFLHGFLSANGFPFVIVHDTPERLGQLRKVVFEDASLSDKFASEWLKQRGVAGRA
jgi:hypothetical protein